MKSKVCIAVTVVVGLQMVLGSREIAQGQDIGGMLGGVIKSMGSSKEDKSMSDSSPYRDSRNDRRGSDEDYRRDDYRQRDDGDRHSRNQGSDPESIVRRSYEDVLNREPDQEGMRLYRSRIIDDNWSEKDVRNDLRKSTERIGLNSASVDGIIRRAYQDVLGREADQSGLATYRAKMMNEGWSERDVRSDLKKSSERHEQVTTEQAQQIVRRAYQNTLGRDPDGGSSVYVEKVIVKHWNEGDVSKALRDSSEYRNKRKK
ncbi:MAG: hypothetical protein WCI03_11295 [bacterium]|jgi:hypothetical protein